MVIRRANENAKGIKMRAKMQSASSVVGIASGARREDERSRRRERSTCVLHTFDAHISTHKYVHIQQEVDR